jgi:hypothetical protein
VNSQRLICCFFFYVYIHIYIDSHPEVDRVSDIFNPSISYSIYFRIYIYIYIFIYCVLSHFPSCREHRQDLRSALREESVEREELRCRELGGDISVWKQGIPTKWSLLIGKMMINQWI